MLKIPLVLRLKTFVRMIGGVLYTSYGKIISSINVYWFTGKLILHLTFPPIL